MTKILLKQIKIYLVQSFIILIFLYIRRGILKVYIKNVLNFEIGLPQSFVWSLYGDENSLVTQKNFYTDFTSHTVYPGLFVSSASVSEIGIQFILWWDKVTNLCKPFRSEWLTISGIASSSTCEIGTTLLSCASEESGSFQQPRTIDRDFLQEKKLVPCLEIRERRHALNT